MNNKIIEEMAVVISKIDFATPFQEKQKHRGGLYGFIAETLYNAGYRKMDEITLKLDLGDRSAEEIQQIAEAFANEPTTAILVPSNESEIRKQVAKEILQEFWHIRHGQTELDNVCISIADKFGLLKELQGE